MEQKYHKIWFYFCFEHKFDYNKMPPNFWLCISRFIYSMVKRHFTGSTKNRLTILDLYCRKVFFRIFFETFGNWTSNILGGPRTCHENQRIDFFLHKILPFPAESVMHMFSAFFWDIKLFCSSKFKHFFCLKIKIFDIYYYFLLFYFKQSPKNFKSILGSVFFYLCILLKYEKQFSFYYSFLHYTQDNLS